MSRPYEITLFGATGFTGGKTAEYLAQHAPADLRWAIAGRSRDKLESLRRRLLENGGACPEIGVVEASVDDQDSLCRMAAQTDVLLSTVGPFIDYGEPVVRACVDQGTHYLDSTGEPQFVDLLLARYAERAAERGVRVVPSCGFDSLPADLGSLFTVQKLPDDQPIELSAYVSIKGVFSGGTERSAIKAMAPAANAVQPPPLQPGDGRRVRLLPAKVTRHPELGWVAPLQTVDASIVARSAATLPCYGPDFSYRHHAVHPSLPAMLVAFFVFGTAALFARFAPLRALLLKAVKKPGQGPTDEQIRRGRFSVRFIARSAGRTLQTEVAGGDPGYGETSKMLSEAALCLARDREALPPRTGVLTPAQAMGDPLIARLQHAGLRFEVL